MPPKKKLTDYQCERDLWYVCAKCRDCWLRVWHPNIRCQFNCADRRIVRVASSGQTLLDAAYHLGGKTAVQDLVDEWDRTRWP